MYTSNMLSTLALLLAISFCSVHSKETQQLEESSLESSNHQPQKRSAAMLEPELTPDDMLMGGASVYDQLPYFIDDDSEADKRSSLFRFGKRGGSLFRFGKRGTLFRFGKRGSLFRFGKRGGTLFRFGRSGPAASDLEQKRSSILRSDLDLVQDALESRGYPVFEEARKRNDGFHWGQEQN